ncbi:MAG TPA: SGNH/GDSL hydrolase family protein [Candidatus Brocadiia bacterium]|nr:SGNH/GDSL hydrolase family protein [Candidatus Brocadiia bacterium]
MRRRDFLKGAGIGALSVGMAMAGAERADAQNSSQPEAGKSTGGIEGNTVEPKRVAEGMKWFDVSAWGVEGKGWDDTERYYDRFPARAKGRIRDVVWSISRNSAGMCARFSTNAKAISGHWILLSSNLAMPHMPATGVSGLDLYAKDKAGCWRWAGLGKPAGNVDAADPLIAGLPGEMTEFKLYLPLYNGVELVEVGVPEEAEFAPIKPRRDNLIVFYGTSIMQGGCASRPGMAHASILGRRLDRPIINLGFSGNGTMDIEIGELIAELDARLYFIDCLPNMGDKLVEERTVPLVKKIREGRPETPIALVEDRTYSHAPLAPGTRQSNDSRRAALRKAYEQLQQEGVPNLHYIEGEPMLGGDGDGTVDGSHPTDLGFVRMADYLEPILRKLN